MNRQIPFERRRALCDLGVTLNGDPAVISGSYNEFATVRSLPSGAAQAQFAWETADHVVRDHNREFKCQIH